MRKTLVVMTLLMSVVVMGISQDLNLKGKVLDQNTKAPLMFANLSIKGYAIGTSTDVEGYFSMNISSNYYDDSLIISMIGYKTQTLAIKNLRDQKGESAFLLAPTSFEFATVEIGAPIILNDIFFEFNKHRLLPESYPELKKLYDYLEKHPDYKIEIAGHTDDVGSDEYNLALSEARAGAVMAWLEEMGIDQRRMTAKGYGESMPIATNETELGQEQNRRVEFKVLEKGFNPFKPKNVVEEPPKKKERLVIGVPKGGIRPIQEAPKAVFKPEKSAQALTADVFKSKVEQILENKSFHGVLMYASKDKMEMQRVFGKANLAYDIPNKADTKFYIGTLAEQFTAVLALKLVQEQEIALTDPIGRFLPNYPNVNHRQNITIGHLLSHTSGFVDAFSIDKSLEKDGMAFDHDGFMKAFANEPLEHQPGEAYHHSALNYYLMAVIIEKVKQQDFEMVLQKEVLEPLKMNQTTVFDLETIDKDLASPYVKKGIEIKNALVSPKSVLMGSSNIASTLGDLYRWDQALRSNTLLDEVHTSVLFRENMDGMSLMGKIEEKGWRSHLSRGAGSEVFYTYSNKMSVIVLSNVADSGAESIYKMVVE